MQNDEGRIIEGQNQETKSTELERVEVKMRLGKQESVE